MYFVPEGGLEVGDTGATASEDRVFAIGIAEVGLLVDVASVLCTAHFHVPDRARGPEPAGGFEVCCGVLDRFDLVANVEVSRL